ncbi:hypothetical protein [Merismopedia glauca]|uniref:SMODS and SLOG-associating 2TM effector domain-containing protein n=1 Tax=Merismopedia glauca CCAP 1448/3 TaxID=1296344 RepID=A0A2T1C8L4_9CYAN|nr:hypothetical protein [Merismopedia glauca]PSB04596.1 hypothetical protein C7B64_03335 [Merismopedia glauca CCAP 1448/3]
MLVNSKSKERQEIDLSQKINQQVERWNTSARILHTIYIGLGTTAVVSSIVVATFTKELGELWTKILAATSAGSVALIKTTDVGRKGNGFRQAHRHLRAEKMLYDEAKVSTEKLVEAFAKAESMIGDVEVKVGDSN